MIKPTTTIALAGTTDTVDAHGGWYDATGDYGKHLLRTFSFSNLFQPAADITYQIGGLFKTYELLSHRPGTDFRQIDRRILDEAMYGADYLTRLHVKGQSFYRSVGAPGPGKLPQDRRIGPDEGNYRIKATKDQSFTSKPAAKKLAQRVTRRVTAPGAGIAHCCPWRSLPLTLFSGDYSNADYLNGRRR